MFRSRLPIIELAPVTTSGLNFQCYKPTCALVRVWVSSREKRALMAERHFHVAVRVLLVAQSICTAFQVTILFLKEE